jgi:Tol biopolymer transport system component
LYQDEEVEGQVPEPVVLDGRYFLRDGHCSYSPDRNWMLYDSYPDQNRLRHLYVYDLREKRGITLGSYYSPPEIDGDIRCDLHPRWIRAGTAITFDSVHEGQRHVYRMDLRSVLKR